MTPVTSETRTGPQRFTIPGPAKALQIKHNLRMITYVYVRSADHVWLPAQQLHTFSGKAKVKVPKFANEHELLCQDRRQQYKDNQVVKLADYTNGVLPMQNVDVSGNLTDHKDMVELPFMHEAAILYNLKLRHTKEKPYTRAGDIVIAVNPYQWFNNLYTEEERAYYSQKLVWERSDEDPRLSMQPHVYEVSALSYKGLALDDEDQSILISGESGAGKTETVKICLNHIASVQKGTTLGGYSDDNNFDKVVQRIVQSNPLLEAFGNAKTRRNDNSSRFGKYLQLKFERNTTGFMMKPTRCALIGSKCEVYLLEKNRVVSHDAEERNFHIFYQLLAASDAEKSRFWNELRGRSKESFTYVGYSGTESIDGVGDGDAFRNTVQTLELVNIKDDRLDTLMKAVIITMQLGNIRFEADSDDSDKSFVSSTDELRRLAELMGVTEKDLRLALTERTLVTPEDTHKVPLSAEMARDARDALAKEVYQKTFLWLVREINRSTCVNEEQMEVRTIGLLDIFGFETFDVNRFEQLCINYANEKLQQKFNEDVFANVKAEYFEEGISLEDIWYDDNAHVLDLIEGPTGLLPLLNEECLRPKGNDKSFVQKAAKEHKKSQALVVNRLDKLSFGINHYAGCVMYDAEMFVSKNVDTLHVDLQSCVEKCNNEIIKAPRSEPVKARKTGNGAAVRRQSNLGTSTVMGKYKNQLASLMGRLRKTHSRYIRCLKPNNKKLPSIMEHRTVVEQLRCAGVVAGITISRSVFPNRLANSLVLVRYSNMWPVGKSWPSGKMSDKSLDEKRAEDCKKLMNAALKNKETYDKGRKIKAFVVGKTKTYFRAGALEWLESNRTRGLDDNAIVIQRVARDWLARGPTRRALQREKIAAKEQERKRQEEVSRRARLVKEADERKKKREIEEGKMKEQIGKLEKQIKDADEELGDRLEEIQARVEKVRAECETLRQNVPGTLDIQKQARQGAAEMAGQEQRLKDRKQMIEHLKKENKKACKEHSKYQNKVNDFLENSQKLEESFSLLENSLSSISSQTHKEETAQQSLKDVLDRAKTNNDIMKKKVLKRQDQYMGEAQVRLELQRSLGKILTMIQERCTDPSILESAALIALDAETAAKSRMATLDTETIEPFLVASDVSETDMSDDNSDSSYELEN